LRYRRLKKPSSDCGWTLILEKKEVSPCRAVRPTVKDRANKTRNRKEKVNIGDHENFNESAKRALNNWAAAI